MRVALYCSAVYGFPLTRSHYLVYENKKTVAFSWKDLASRKRCACTGCTGSNNSRFSNKNTGCVYAGEVPTYTIQDRTLCAPQPNAFCDFYIKFLYYYYNFCILVMYCCTNYFDESNKIACYPILPAFARIYTYLRNAQLYIRTCIIIKL